MEKAKFPIIEHISTAGVVKEHIIPEGAKLICLRCAKPFYASGDTVSESENGNTYLTCPHCDYKGSSFYYARQKSGRIVS